MLQKSSVSDTKNDKKECKSRTTHSIKLEFTKECHGSWQSVPVATNTSKGMKTKYQSVHNEDNCISFRCNGGQAINYNDQFLCISHKTVILRINWRAAKQANLNWQVDSEFMSQF